MTNVQVQARISGMRQAARELRASGNRIQESVRQVQLIGDSLIAQRGFEGAGARHFETNYLAARGRMNDWGQVLGDFAAKLEGAADDLEQALVDSQAYQAIALREGGESLISAHVPGLTAAPLGLSALGSAAEAPAPVPLDAYVAGSNRSLHNELRDLRSDIESNEALLATLGEEREQRVQDMLALRNRLSGEGLDPEKAAVRLQGIQTQIDQIDAQISSTQGEIATMQGRVADITERLELVKPAPGADLQLIASLEHSTTNEWIQRNTQDCVQHITHKLAIPPGLPNDAHLWDDNALRHPEYGIQIGERPLPGSVIVLEREHSYADDRYGHLFYVESVEGDQVWVTDNKFPDQPVLLSELTEELSGPNVKVLYFPWHTRA